MSAVVMAMTVLFHEKKRLFGVGVTMMCDKQKKG